MGSNVWDLNLMWQLNLRGLYPRRGTAIIELKLTTFIKIGINYRTAIIVLAEVL